MISKRQKMMIDDKVRVAIAFSNLNYREEEIKKLLVYYRKKTEAYEYLIDAIILKNNQKILERIAEKDSLKTEKRKERERTDAGIYTEKYIEKVNKILEKSGLSEVTAYQSYFKNTFINLEGVTDQNRSRLEKMGFHREKKGVYSGWTFNP